jgi:hypothetical protein
MALHRIPCETFSLDECQMAIAHHIVTSLCTDSPVQGVIGLPSDACRVAGSVVERKELALRCCNVSVSPIFVRNSRPFV